MPPTPEFLQAIADFQTAAEAKGAKDFATANPPVDETTVVAQTQADDLAAVNAAKDALAPAE